MPAGSRGSIGGEIQAPGAKCVRRLKLVTVSRVRHSTVSLHRVHLLKKKVRLFVFLMDESKVKEIIAQNNQDLLSRINYLVSTSISDLKRSSDSNAAEQMSEIKRPKRDDPQSFKKKSNEQQFKVNISILAAVEDASVVVDRKDLQKSKEALERGLSLLKDRQKLILLADKSP